MQICCIYVIETPMRMNESEAIHKRLKQKGLKVTPTRMAVAKTLRKKHQLMSARQVFECISKDNESHFDRVTVYRCLETMKKKGLVETTYFDSKRILFEWSHEEDHHDHHHHIRCRSCDRIESIEECHFHLIENQLTDLGFSKIEHHMEFTGTCARCSN